MALRHHVISVDDHVQETPDVWTSRLFQDAWGDRVPHISKQSGGVERWVIDGRVQEDRQLTWTGALASERFDEPQTWEQVPKAAYDPAERLKAMDQDAVDVQVLFPSAAGIGGQLFGAIKDPKLEQACVQAYNDWLIEVWAAASPRFVPQCIVPISSVEAAKAEVERAVAKGHRRVVMPPFAWHINEGAPHLHDHAWDPLWATVQDAGVPICFHSGTSDALMLDLYPKFNKAATRSFDSVRQPISSAQVILHFIISRIGERFPNLKVVFAASGIDWVSFQLELADHEWGNAMLAKEGMDLKPTDIFHRQCYVTTWFEKAAFGIRGFLGIDNIMWQSEFPRETSTWPRSAEFIDRNLADLPAEERAKVVWRNAAKLYNIEG